MAINVAINGFGRIGRMVYRAAMEDKKINIIAVNDLTDTKNLAYLLKYDSVHGTLKENVGFTANTVVVGKNKIQVFSQKDPALLPWKKLKIDVVIESTGFFRNPDDAKVHLDAGARKVIISAPCKCDGPDNICPANTKTIVMGVNEKTYNKAKHHIISNASCTTNCVAPVLKVLDDNFTIARASFSTIHASTSTERVVDGPSKDPRKGRAVGVNIIPTSTGADVATVEAIPNLKGKIRGTAFRVPVINGSVTDFVVQVKKEATVNDVNQAFKKAALSSMKGIMQYAEAELVSTDIIGNPYSSIVDSKLTKVIDKRLIQVVAWYDNEWGYSKRVVELIKLL